MASPNVFIQASLIQSLSQLKETVPGLTVWHIQAAPSTKFPYISLNMQSGGTVNTSPRDSFEASYKVMCFSDDADQSDFIGGLVRDLFHKTTPLLQGGWNCYYCKEYKQMQFTSNVQGNPVYACGSFFEIKTDH